MTGNPFYKEHWINIDPERLDRYQRMFEWNSASAELYASADIRSGQIVADFGCGPGHTAIEIAKWVGPRGHVHALDINLNFVSQSRDNAKASGLGDRITAYQCDGSLLPLPDNSLDRLTARNTLIYVDDPERTLREFHRVLKPGGKVHAIEGDWLMMVVEPIPSDEWTALVKAAAHACRTPDIGRKLHGLLGQVGFSEINLQVVTRPDAQGRLLPMIKNMAGYALANTKRGEVDPHQILSSLERCILDGTYLALAPQFVVTAMR